MKCLFLRFNFNFIFMISDTMTIKQLTPLLIIWLFTHCTSGEIKNSEEEIVNLSKRKFEWLINNEMDSLDALLDDQLVYIHSNGLIESKQDVFDNNRSGKLKLDEVTVRESNARIFENTAIVTGKGRFIGIIDGNVFDVELLYSEVYVMKSGKWRLVQRHANR